MRNHTPTPVLPSLSKFASFGLDERCELRNYAPMTETPLKEIFHSRGIRLVTIASALGVDKGTVTKWLRSKIPAERVKEIEQVTGVPRHELRPDIWDAPQIEAAE